MGANARRTASEDVLSRAILTNPSQDVHPLLTPQELALWSFLDEPSVAGPSYVLSPSSSSSTLDEILKRLRAFEDVIYINVRLVGFDGDGEQGLDISEAEFQKYFNALLSKTRDRVSVIHPEGNEPHQLKIQKKVMFDVSKAKRSVAEAVHYGFQTHLDREAGLVPAWVTEQVLQDDYYSEDIRHFTIYVVNPKKPIEQYAYSQTTRVSDAVCKTTVGAAKDRFAWVDISAGPLVYGPQTSGEGLVTEADIPSLKRHPQVQKSPESFMIDLTSFVQRTVEFLIAPSPYRLPAWGLNKNVVVHLVLVHDHLVGEEERFSYFDYDTIKKELGAVEVFGNHSITFRQSEFSLVDNNLLASVWTNSIKTHTSSVTRVAVQAYVNQYLDSKELHSHLGRYRRTLLGEDDAAEWVVPVFLFDVSNTDLLLIDRTHQAVSFPDMVIAVQTPLSRVVFDYQCSGRTLAVDPKDATRPVMGALVSTVWGVAPTHQAWDPLHNRIKENYLWAVGGTPFGPFSPSVRLTFAQTDPARRFRLYGYIERTLRRLTSLFRTYAEYDLELEDGLSPEAYEQLMQRWNLLQFKFEKASTFMGLGDYSASLAFLESTGHELDAITRLLSSATEFIDSRLACTSTGSAHGGLVRQGAMLSVVVMLAMFVVSLLRRQGIVSALLGKHAKTHAS